MTRRQTLTAVAIAIVLASATPAAAFLVQYSYYCYATHSDGIPIADDDILTGEDHVDGDVIKTGDHGNYGSAEFCADIHTATISVRAHSHGVQIGPYSFPSGTGRVERCRFQDRLFFTVPAGYYPDGVEVRIHGLAMGSLGSEVGAGAQGRCSARLGSSTYDTGLLEVGVAESNTVVVNESFELVVRLVEPGATLDEQSVYDEFIDLEFSGGRTWSTSYNPGGGSVIGDGDISFPDGLRLTALTIPAGVSWISESGVFPGLPTDVSDDPSALPGARLLGNYPNPFNPETIITFTLAREEWAELGIYALSGRLVTVLSSGDFSAGIHSVSWKGRDGRGRAVPSGTYIVRLETNGHLESSKVTLVR